MIPVSLQLWSIRDVVNQDFAAAMREVSSIGFTGVELAGYGKLDAAGAAEAMRAAGLRCSGLHVGIDRLRGDLHQVVIEARLFETTHVICPWMPPALFCDAASAAQFGGELDAIGSALRGYGLHLHFHNHAAEFAVVDGRTVIDWLLDAAAPRNLSCEADVYWIHTAGRNPAAFLREQGRRVRLIHLKDETELGSGPVDFPELFSAIDSVAAAEWLIIEVEKYSFTPMVSVRRSFAQLREWGRA